MFESNIQGKKSYYIALILALSVLVLGSSLPSMFIFLFSLLCWIAIFFVNQKKSNINFSILRMLILSVPLSFTNVFGQLAQESNLVWFNIFFLILLLIFSKNVLVSNSLCVNDLAKFSIVIIFVSLMPVLTSPDMMDGFRQFIFFAISCMAIVIGTEIKKRLTKNQKEQLLIDYISATKIVGIGLIVQILYMSIIDQEIGFYRIYGGDREAFGFLFLDFSFVSLFLSSGAMAIYFMHRKGQNLEKYWFIKMVFLLVSSLLTTARTGIVAFVATISFCNVFMSGDLIRKRSIKIIFYVFLNSIVLIGGYIGIYAVRPERGFADSGRNTINQRALNIFLDNPFLGIGFGRNNIINSIGVMPHNIFFQSLVQGGLLFAIPLFLFLLTILWIAYKKNRTLFPVILCVLIGAFFIPNIFNSRFLTILLFILSINM